MNREEILNKYIDLIDKGYCCACNELNCIDNFPHAKITHAIKELQQENQELRKQNETIQEKFKEWKKDIEKERKFYLCERDCAFRLKESKKYLSYTQQIEKLKQENQELKKELEEKNKPQICIDNQDIEERYAEGLYQDYLEEENKKYKNQQKEFIEWLESYLKLFDNKDIYEEGSYDTIEEILSKYKEIIEK